MKFIATITHYSAPTSVGYTTGNIRAKDGDFLSNDDAYLLPPGEWRCASTGSVLHPDLQGPLNDALSLYHFKKSQEEAQ